MFKKLQKKPFMNAKKGLKKTISGNDKVICLKYLGAQIKAAQDNLHYCHQEFYTAHMQM